MPNGYTYKVEDGTVTTFHDFALDCAEAPEDPQTWLDDHLDRARQEVTYHAEQWVQAQESAASPDRLGPVPGREPRCLRGRPRGCPGLMAKME